MSQQTTAGTLPITSTGTRPADVTTTTGFGPTLTWNSSRRMTQYHLQVTPINDDGPALDLHVGRAATSFTIPPPPEWYGLLPDMTYTWQVHISSAPDFVPLDDPSWLPWASGRFRTPKVDSTTIQASEPPLGGWASSLTPTLIWTNSRSDVFYYEVQLSADPAFDTNPATATAPVYWELRHGGVTDPPNSYTVPEAFSLTPGVTYYWRVRPRIQGDGSPVAWSTTFTFKTSPALQAVQRPVPPIPPDQAIVRLNVGGPAYTDSANQSWASDLDATWGVPYTTDAVVAGTPDPPLYQTARYGDFTYTFSLPNGNYNVTLKFAEPYWTEAGKRVFNVALQGRPALANFDILAETSPWTALDKTLPATVSNGTLTITFSSLVDYAVVSAIKVAPAGAPTSAAYWGADNYGPPWDMSVQDRLEGLVGKRASLMPFGLPWMSNGSYLRFPALALEAIRRRGAIPVVSWASWDLCCGPDQAAFRNAAIAGGAHDAFLHQFARDVKAWGKPFFLRLNAEMNGWWTWSYSEQLNGNTPGSFVQAWRHVHDIFVQEGATNVTWVWCPNIASSLTTPYWQLYPGDSYVDWTCLDGYNAGNERWQSFSEVFAGTGGGAYNSYQLLLDLAPNKPIMLGEWASAEDHDDGSRKAAWIRDALEVQIPHNFPQVRAVIWYNQPQNWLNLPDYPNWQVDSSAKAAAAFAAGIASNYYVGNLFANLWGGPIPPPTP